GIQTGSGWAASANAASDRWVPRRRATPTSRSRRIVVTSARTLPRGARPRQAGDASPRYQGPLPDLGVAVLQRGSETELLRRRASPRLRTGPITISPPRLCAELAKNWDQFDNAIRSIR